ncbi:DUF1329 domain-containing protein [Azospirillum thermophilum]|uniref:DUF1329 domain-containing protein n=1 Tax=Azospirillum thermophilum TaxID=2202148 RepID=A0A2S2CSE2_9PROT|nr:DUF1329 domain-containing protein [Azospirillum thermophilum]AWK87431.1 DUF1329 domain-containing protein [Azospirillum thermophilum]
MRTPLLTRRAAVTGLLGAGLLGTGGALIPAAAQGPQPATQQAPQQAAPGAAPAVPRLGEELTPFGAVRAGNRARSIPPWTGGMTAPPKGFVAGRHPVDPFLDDGRWFTVMADELERYRPRLSAGLQALLQKFPGFEIPIFPTRRTAAAPQAVYEASIANAGRARLEANGLVLSGAQVGVPFPIPADGAQAMWNHVLRWRGLSASRTTLTALPSDAGIATSTLREEFLSPYAGDRLAEAGGRPLFYRRTQLGPGEGVGNTLLIQGTLDPLRAAIAVWYRQGERGRPQRAPDFSYDTPDPATGGIRTADMLDMFSGAMDRFDFTLVTRREMYVPYNAFRMNVGGLAPGDFLWPGHPNPQFLRYELHRVWVVDAKAKPAFRHALPDRTYYMDEDSWQIVMAEHYDAKGELVRYAEAHGVPYGQVPVFAPAMEITYDLPGNRYVVSGIDNTLSPPAFDRLQLPADFTPEALTRKGRR